MGMTDFEVAENYSSTVSDILNDLHVGAKVAWLGQKHPSSNQDKFLYDAVMSGVHVNLDHHFYDLNNDEFEKSVKWDVHGDWDIGGYDLVLGLRVLYLCDSRDKMLKNISKICKTNEKVIFDFMTGNPVLIGGRETFIKRNNSPTILPYFPELYNENIEVNPNHDDQVVTLKNFEDLGINFKNITTFRDGIKRRFYTLCEVSCDA